MHSSYKCEAKPTTTTLIPSNTKKGGTFETQASISESFVPVKETMDGSIAAQETFEMSADLVNCNETAVFLAHQGHFDLAAKCFEQGVSKVRRHMNAPMLRFSSLVFWPCASTNQSNWSENHCDEGMRYYKESISVKELNSPGILFYNLGLTRLKQKRTREAFASFVQSMCEPRLCLPALHNVGYLQYAEGETSLALKTFIEALDCCENSSETASTLNCMAVCKFHRNSFDPRTALLCLEQALTLQSEFEDVSIATTLNNLGRAHCLAGSFDKAVIFFEKALDLRCTALGEQHLDTAATIYNVGEAYQQLGENDKALRRYEDFIRIAITKRELYNNISFIFRRMAEVHERKGEREKSLEAYGRALLCCQSRMGVLNAEVASILNKVGNIYYDFGKYEMARIIYEQGLHIERSVLDSLHPNIAVTLCNIGQIHKRNKDYEKALLLYQEAYFIQRSSLGNHDSRVAGTLSNIALMEYLQEKYPAALKVYQEVLTKQKQVHGNCNGEVAATLNSIGLTMFKQGELIGALECFNKSMQIRRALFGTFRHRDIATNLYNIATIYVELGNENNALRCYDHSLKIEKELFGFKCLGVARTLGDVAGVKVKLEAFKEAIALYLEALQIQLEHLPEANPVIISTLRKMGHVYFLSGETASCVEVLSLAQRLSIIPADQLLFSTMDFTTLDFFHYLKLSPGAAAMA